MAASANRRARRAHLARQHAADVALAIILARADAYARADNRERTDDDIRTAFTFLGPAMSVTTLADLGNFNPDYFGNFDLNGDIL